MNYSFLRLTSNFRIKFCGICTRVETQFCDIELLEINKFKNNQYEGYICKDCYRYVIGKYFDICNVYSCSVCEANMRSPHDVLMLYANDVRRQFNLHMDCFTDSSGLVVLKL